MRLNSTPFFLILITCLFLTKSLQAQSVVIKDTSVTNVKAGNWSDPTIWSSSSIPGNYDSISLQYDVVVDIDATCKALTLNGHNVSVSAGKNLIISGSTIIAKDNARYIDSTLLKLISTEANIAAGIYKYSFAGATPDIKTGNVIYGITDKGYIRRVTSATYTSNTVQFTTTQGNMSDIISDGQLHFTLPSGGLKETAAKTSASTPAKSTEANEPYKFNVKKKTLLSKGPLEITMDTAMLSFDPNFIFDMKFSNGGNLDFFEMGCKQAALKGEMKFTIAAQDTLTAEKIDTFFRGTVKKNFQLGWLPVVVYANVYLIGKAEFYAEAAISKSITLNANALFDLSLNYKNNEWGATTSYTPTATYKLTDAEGKVKLKVALSLKPYIDVLLYNCAGPYIYFGFNNTLEGEFRKPSLNWDFSYKTNLEAGVGVKYDFYKDFKGEFGPKVFSKDIFTYRTPFSVNKISGDQQSGDTSHFLPAPIKVQVLDENKNRQKNVQVNFKVTAGGGSVKDSVVITDTAGYAETYWKYGSKGPKQEVKVIVYKGDSTEIGDKPVFFRSGKDSLHLTIYNQSNTPAFTTNTFKSLGVGKGGYIFAGTQNQGLYTFDSAWTKQSILTNHNINQIQTGKDSAIWIALTGTSTSVGGGIARITNPANAAGTFQLYSQITTDAPNRNPRSIFIDTTGTGLNIWTAHMGNNQTVGDPSGSASKGFLPAAPYFKRVTAGIQTISQGGTGNCQIVAGDSSEVWVFAYQNNGRSQLLRYDTKTASPKGFYDNSTTPTVFRKPFFAKSIYFGVNGTKWVGFDSSVAVKEGNTWVNVTSPFIPIYPEKAIVNTHAITGDSNGNIYIGTDHGFYMYLGGDYNDLSSWARYTTADSLPSNNILNITVDEKYGRVIFATDAGIAIWKR